MPSTAPDMPEDAAPAAPATAEVADTKAQVQESGGEVSMSIEETNRYQSMQALHKLHGMPAVQQGT